MGFWSGFEGLTGHQPGAFKGFSLKDIIDDDLWKRKQRTWSGKMLPQGATEAERQRDLRFSRGGEPMMTNWYKGRGAGGVPIQGDQREEVTSRNRPDISRAQTRAFPYLPKPIAENLLTPSWAGSAASADRDVGMGANRFLQLGDPRNIRSGPDLPPASGFRSPATGMLPAVGRDRPFPIARRADIASQAEQDRLRAINSGNPAALRAAGITPAMADKTIVKKTFADPNISDTVTETIKQKVQTGHQWPEMRIPRVEPRRVRVGQDLFQADIPTPIPNYPIDEWPPKPAVPTPLTQTSGPASEDDIREMLRVLEGMKARRGY